MTIILLIVLTIVSVVRSQPGLFGGENSTYKNTFPVVEQIFLRCEGDGPMQLEGRYGL